MPFGKQGSEKEQYYKTVYDHIIKRAIMDGGLDCLRADEIPDSGPVPETVKEQLRTSDLVLADLSDRNPNVFYELGFRHALGRPSITISDDVSALPFNLATYSTIQYTTADLAAADRARDKIKENATKILRDMGRRATCASRKTDIVLPDITEMIARLDQGFSNVYQLLGDQFPGRYQELLQKDLSSQGAILKEIHAQLAEIERKSEAMGWTAIFRETRQRGVYDLFSEAHFDQPWNNEALAIPFSGECEAAVAAKLRNDLRLAQQEIAAAYVDE